MAIENKRQRIIRRFAEWSESSTIAGYSNFYRTEKWLIKALWLVSFLAAIGFCGYLCLQSVMQYLEYDVNTESRYFRDSQMAMPGITVCTANTLRSEVGYEYALNYSRQHINSSITSISQWADFLTPTDIWLQKTSFLGQVPQNYDFDLNYSRMILRCQFGSQNCTEFRYGLFYDTYYGNCFNFNSDGANPYEIHKVEYSDGFRVIVYTGDFKGSTENAFNTDSGRGIRLFFFNQTRTEEKNFIRLGPGYCHYIRLRKFVRNSLPAPYSTCQLEDSIDSAIYKRMKARNYTYSQSLCVSWCLQEKIIEKCGCYYNWLLPVDDVTKVCKEKADVECGDDKYYHISSNSSLLCPDQCPMPCSRVSYDYMYSFDLFPGAFDTYTFYKQKIKSLFPEIKEENITDEFVRDNVVCAYAYFDTLDYSYTNETPSKTIVQLSKLSRLV